jgi:hypothetical protein
MSDWFMKAAQVLNWLDGAWASLRGRIQHRLVARLVAGRSGRLIQLVRTDPRDPGVDSRGVVRIADDKRLSIVIVSYRQPDQLSCLLHAFACQTLQNFEILVLHDGADAPTRNVVERFAAEHPLVPCRYIETSQRFNDYGHSLRQIGINEARHEYILITNGDNYYAARFVEFIFAAIDDQALDAVVFDMVHSHFSYAPFSTAPLRWGKQRWAIDMGAIVVRTDMARSVGFRDKTYQGDASYVEDLLGSETGPRKVGKLQRTLFVHN